VDYDITRFYKTLTFTSFYCKIIGNYALIAISTPKKIMIALFALETKVLEAFYRFNITGE